jgi:hypothetical protein
VYVSRRLELDTLTKEWIGQPSRACRVRKVGVDNEYRHDGQDDTVTKPIEANECILRPKDAVVVAVKEVAMLL